MRSSSENLRLLATDHTVAALCSVVTQKNSSGMQLELFGWIQRRSNWSSCQAGGCSAKTSMKPTIEMLSRSFDFAKKKTGLQVGERTLQESPLTEKVSFTSLWGIQPLACRSSQFPVGKMTKRWLGRYQHGKAFPPTQSSWETKRFFCLFQGWL